MISHLDELDDYAALASFIGVFPGVVTVDELASARDRFEDVCTDSIGDAFDMSSPDDESWVHHTADRIAASARVLGIDFEDEIRQLRRHAVDIAGPDPDEDDYRTIQQAGSSGSAEEQSESEIDLMFEGLRTDSEEVTP